MVISGTTLFGKVYRTIFLSKRRRLAFKTWVIMYIKNDTEKILENMCKYIIFTYIYICYKIKT